LIRGELTHEPDGVNLLRMSVREEGATIRPRNLIANNALNHWNDGIDAHFA
jgi:hypothetical protein